MSPGFEAVTDGGGLRATAGARVDAGELYLRTYAIHGDPLVNGYDVLERVASGEVLYALRHGDGCFGAADKFDAPFLFNLVRDSDGQHWVGRYDIVSVQLAAAYPFANDPGHLAWFTLDEGWGLHHGDSVDVALDPSLPVLTEIAKIAATRSVRGRANLVAWVDWNAWFDMLPTPVRGWTEAGGVVTLVEGAYDVGGLGLGEDHIVWLGVTGPNTILGAYDTARVFWSPFTTDPAEIQVVAGPFVSGLVAGGVHLAVGGDHVALEGTTGIIVLHMSSMQLWTIQPQPGTFLRLMALNANEILAMETPDTGGAEILRYYRFAVAELDTLAQGNWDP